MLHSMMHQTGRRRTAAATKIPNNTAMLKKTKFLEQRVITNNFSRNVSISVLMILILLNIKGMLCFNVCIRESHVYRPKVVSVSPFSTSTKQRLSLHPNSNQNTNQRRLQQQQQPSRRYVTNIYSSKTPSSSESATNETTSNMDGTGNNKSNTKQFEDDAKQMKVGELKQVLESNGISTRTFIEKSEFIKAYVQLQINGGGNSVKTSTNTKTSTSSSSSSSTKSSSQYSSSTSSSSKKASTKEERDPSYRDVTVYKMDRNLLQGGGSLIDIKIQ